MQPWMPPYDRTVPPGEPFPRLNDRRDFARIVASLRVARWAVPVGALAALVVLVFGIR